MADILPDLMDFEIVAFDFPDAFAAVPKVYAKRFTLVQVQRLSGVYLPLFIQGKRERLDQNQVQNYLLLGT